MPDIIQPKLWGIKIWDATGNYFYTEVDISTDVQHNRPTGSQVGYNQLYPYHTHNGIASYFSGSCSGNFSDNQSGECYEDYNFDYRVDSHGNYIYNTKYIKSFVKWLHNDLTKQLQLSEDFIIPVGILGEVKWSTDHSVDDGYSCKVSFDWEQIGDDYELTDSGLITTCPNCQNIIAPTSIYCPKCGTQVNS